MHSVQGIRRADTTFVTWFLMVHLPTIMATPPLKIISTLSCKESLSISTHRQLRTPQVLHNLHGTDGCYSIIVKLGTVCSTSGSTWTRSGCKYTNDILPWKVNKTTNTISHCLFAYCYGGLFRMGPTIHFALRTQPFIIFVVIYVDVRTITKCFIQKLFSFL